MSSLTQKIRNVFSWHHDSYEFEKTEENPVPKPTSSDVQTTTAKQTKKKKFKSKEIQTSKRHRGAISKISKDNEKLNNILVTRNSSISSAHLNAAVPLVKIRRLPSRAEGFHERVRLSAFEHQSTSQVQPVREVQLDDLFQLEAPNK
uniref:(northern house mosquito) hypothetical protein n=1 Tax=Culex pipiens TaxID=7175 RepID=A0A8D7ZVQ2_CULPI